MSMTVLQHYTLHAPQRDGFDTDGRDLAKTKIRQGHSDH
jgi:hypothetical protein